jgi:phospholipid/cholesterol/gamma-HCH transport system substrate-binding protein
MAAPTNHWKLGLFVVSGFAMSLTAVAVLGARSLQKEEVRYVSYFGESVQGLEVGSPIKFRGVTIGTIGKIDIAPDHRLVEVSSDLGITEMNRLGLNRMATPALNGSTRKLAVETDLRVQLVSTGLTGVKFLELDFFPVADNPPPVLSFDVPENYIPAASSSMKSIEDSLVRVMARMPEIADQLSAILGKVDGMVGDLKDKQLPERIITTLDNTNRLLTDAGQKLDKVDTAKISKSAEKTLAGLNEAVGRMNKLLAGIDSDKGLIASVTRTSDALGDSAHEVDGLGSRLEDTLQAVQDAAKSIHKLASALEKDPDMLLKGRSRGEEKNR